MNQFRKKLTKIKNLLNNAEKASLKFKKTYKLDCFAGCGKCCSNDSVEASSLEFLPLAEDIWKNGGALELLEKLKDIDSLSPCVFYVHDGIDSTKGFCSAYKMRGLICRLFGFSLRKNKAGGQDVLTCKAIKEKYNLANVLFEDTEQEYLMSAYYLQLADIDYSRAFKRFPINQAIMEAMLEYGLLNSFHKPRGTKQTPSIKAS
ncbi:MAG: YkgJ family cysteine cluster protein [Candidatus Margulisbacteria bacterium]|nr:YkgJ family cysteine cluster protein [Candidatus Margulisiibacteriota bacterium]